MQRARLIVNPQATTTSPRSRDVITQALASELSLDVATTQGRGHAAELAFEARQAEFDVVLVLGGDGTVNEVVNGLLADGLDVANPMLGVVPGGSTNVFARAIGMPEDHTEATGMILELLREGTDRVLGLGRADQRWFTFTAGLGLDAEVVARIERKREAGRRSSHGLYVRTALAAMAEHRSSRSPRLTLTGLDDPFDDTVSLLLVGNTSPWTYLGRRPVDPFPGASFDLGLDVLALRRLGLTRTLGAARQALIRANHPPAGRNVLHRHDLPSLIATSDAPVPLQVDGDYVGTAEAVRFHAVPKALRVLGRGGEPLDADRPNSL